MEDLLEFAIKKYKLKKFTIKHKIIKDSKISWAYLDPIMLLPHRGLKVHISATILNSVDILHIAIPWLLINKIAFKVIVSNTLLKKLNDNMFGYLHTGKFITIYPKNNTECIFIATELDKLLINHKSIPIPSDDRFKNSSTIYYGYDPLPIINSDLLLDIIPFPKQSFKKKNNHSLLLNKYIIIETIRQRARGGIYLALEIIPNQHTCRKVIIKEARDFSEIECSGVDAVERLHWQFKMLDKLFQLNITPKPYELLKNKNTTLLAMQYLQGRCLREMIISSQNFDMNTIIDITIKTALHIKKLHFINLYFLELCPDNIIILPNNTLKLIDCDLCYTDGAPEFIGWNYGTPGFFPSLNVLEGTCVKESDWFYLRDIYALGSILFSLLFPNWYKDLFLGTSKRKSHQVKLNLINSLPNELQNLISRSMLLRKPFSGICEFIDNLKLVI